MPGLTPRKIEVLDRQVSAGADARAFLDRAARTCDSCGHGSSIFQERIQQTIREAIGWFRSPSAASDSHVAIRYIAALAEIFALKDALEFRVQQAEKATEKMHGGDQTAG